MYLTSGLPKGSVLGPLLFLFYINDLPDLWMNVSKFYADDSKIIGKDVDTQEGVKRVQDDIDATSDWVDDWLMQLNDGKCAVVHMGKRNPKAKYTIRKQDGTRVELHCSEGETDLGVTVDNELAFSEHIRASVNTNKCDRKSQLRHRYVKECLRLPRCRHLDKAVCQPGETTFGICSECLETTTA